ncbi:MAG: type III secretion system translocon subunit SctE [Candidatus Accumulibacter sp.]|jgi:hypothetical protein|nr:type III secretion system translocon subunit SctE [Accumulibacter sp.]
MTTVTLNGMPSGYPTTPEVDAPATGNVGGGGDGTAENLPPVDTAADDFINTLFEELPKLIAPLLAGSISLEELVKAVGLETRQITTKTGLETLKAKAAEREEASQKKIEELQTQLEKLREQEKLSPFMKAFKWIGMVLGAIAAVATAAVAIATANPLLIVGAAIMLTMTINSIVSEATDGKYSISAGVAELAKQCGADEETAQWIGMGVEIGITVIGAVLSLGAGAAGSAAKTAEMAGKVINIAARIGQLASLGSGLTTMAQGGLSIVSAGFDKAITESRAAQKELEAILERIMEAQDIETKFMEAVMKRAEELLASVQEIVQGNTEAQAAILTSQPPAVA